MTTAFLSPITRRSASWNFATDRDPVTLLHQPGGGQPSITLVPPAATGARSEDGDLSLVDLSELRGIEVKRRARGAFDGLVWGFLAGAAAGAIAGARQGDDPPGQLIRFTAGQKAVGGGLLFGGDTSSRERGADIRSGGGGPIGLLAPGDVPT